MKTNNVKDIIEAKRHMKSNFINCFSPKSFGKDLYLNTNLQNKMIPNSKRTKKTKNWHAIIHCKILVGPSDLGDFEIIGREKSRNGFKLKINKSLIIKKLSPPPNDNDQSIPLYLF